METEPGAGNAPFIPRIEPEYFASEKSLEFVIEALLFATMMAISAWPIVAAIDALNQLLQRTPS